MKHNNILFGILAGLLALSAIPAQSRDERLRFPIKDAMEAAEASGKLDPDIKLFFGEQKHSKVVRAFGEFSTNKKTNFFNKSDKQACEWAFLSAIIALQKRAQVEGGNAVIEIASVYRGGNLSSATEYECGAGNVTGGVALRGKVAQL